MMDRMSRRLRCVMVALWVVALVALVGCASHVPSSTPSAAAVHNVMYAASATTLDGDEVARQMQRRYNDTVASCAHAGNAHLPAALCSGILMRSTLRGAGYRVWNPNPSSRLANGVSFSWLRRDAAFNGTVFDYTNGFVVMPYTQAEASGFTRLTVLCAYVFDADTFNRPGGANDGCAEHTAQAGTQPCQAQGVFTSVQWLAKFRSVADRYIQQCAFIVSPGTPDADRAFMAIPAVRASLGSTSVTLHDEVMVSTWPQDDRHVPVEAFFFRSGTRGVVEARSNQTDFQAATGRFVPVIEITLPTTPGGSAAFRYVP